MIWILILSFGLLWVLADTQVFDAMMAGPRNMGEVNRESISYAEFNQRVNLFTEQHRQQTGASPDSEVRAQYEEMAWEQLVVDKILKQIMQDMGITVTDSELIDMVTGENPDPFIRQQFADEDGNINRAALQNAIEAPENREIWIMIEQQLREQRRQQKLSHFLETSMRVSEFEILQHYKNQNSLADFRYVRIPYSEISTNEIEITDSDLRSFYNNNQHRFKRNKSWRFSYVSFSIEPTSEDTTRTLNRLTELRDDFRQTEDVERFLSNNYSETSYYEDFLNPSEVRREHLAAYNLEVGEVSEPYIFNNRAHMIRLLEERPSDETYVRVRQIEMPDDDVDLEDAIDLFNRIERGMSFEHMARLYSSHEPSTEHGGDLGYISRDNKPEVLANAIFNASVGSLIGPIESGGSFYIFRIEDRTNREVRFADMSVDVEADPFATVQRLANEAEDFQYFAASDGFFEEAERNNYNIQDGVATDGNPFISGLGMSRIILNELATMRSGDVSDVIETEEQFIILYLEEVTPEGVRPFSEVRSQVESLVREQKRKELLTRRVSEMLANGVTLEEFAERNDRSILTAEDVRLNAVTIPGSGREPKVIGAAFSLPPGERSPAIAGNDAVFVLTVDNRTEADITQITAEDRQEIREMLQEQKNATFESVWVDRLKAGSSIRDFRNQQQLMQPPM